MKKHLLIDMNNIVYRAYHVSKLTNKKGERISGAFNSMRMVTNLMRKFRPDSVVIAWDLGKSKSRLKVYPEYKAQREKSRNEEDKIGIAKNMAMLKKIFSYLPVKQIEVQDIEADDILWWLSKKLKGKKILVSNDSDFIQLVSKDVRLYMPMAKPVWTKWDKKKKMVAKSYLLSPTNVDRFIGFKRKYYVLWKSLVGDSCLHGNTKIKLLNGKHIKIKDMTDKSGYWVYSFDTKSKMIVPGKASNSVITKHVKTIIRIELDNGDIIKCTPNHPFLLSDGETYIQAENLGVGDSLLPLYHRQAKREYSYGNYEEIHQKFRVNHNRGKWQLTHRMVREHMSNGKKIKRSVHHINHNTKDNRPVNLKWVSDSEHMLIHNNENDYSNVKNKWANDSDYRDMMRMVSSKVGKVTGRINITKYNKSKEKLDKQSKRLRNLSSKGEHPFQINRVKLLEVNRKVGLERAKNKELFFQQKGYHKKLNSNPKVKIQQQKGKIYKIYKVMISEGLDFMDWSKALKILKDKGIINKNSISNPLTYFDSIENIQFHNHSIISIKKVKLNKFIPVYDIKVKKYKNFALDSGIFVHNSDTIKGIKGIGPVKAFKIISEGRKKKLPLSSEEAQILDRNKYLIAIGAVLQDDEIKAIKKTWKKSKEKANEVRYSQVRKIFRANEFKSLLNQIDEIELRFSKLRKGNNVKGKKEKSGSKGKKEQIKKGKKVKRKKD